MNAWLRERIIAYRASMSIFRSMVCLGILTEAEYAKMDTIIAKKHGLNSCTIFR